MPFVFSAPRFVHPWDTLQSQTAIFAAFEAWSRAHEAKRPDATQRQAELARLIRQAMMSRQPR